MSDYQSRSPNATSLGPPWYFEQSSTSISKTLQCFLLAVIVFPVSSPLILIAGVPSVRVITL